MGVQWPGSDEGATLIRALIEPQPGKPIPIPTTNASREVLGRPALLIGYSFRETTGSATATLEIINGQDGTGVIVGEIALAASGAETEIIGHPGLFCDNGLYLSVVSGSVRGSMWARF